MAQGVEGLITNDVYVAPPTIPGVLEGGDGTRGRPFHSVAKAMREAADAGGGVVRLHGGHYVESVVLDTFGKNGDLMLVTGDGCGGEVFIDSMLPEFLGPPDTVRPLVPPRPSEGRPGS